MGEIKLENIEFNNNIWEKLLVIRDCEEVSSELKKFQCQKCGKLLGKYQGCKQLEIKCPRCRHINTLNYK